MKILFVSQSDLRVPPLLYGGSERILHNLCSSLPKSKYSINLIAGKDSNVYGGRTLSFINYRFGKSFLGRCFSWVEFQTQCLRLLKGVDLIHCFSFFPERFFLLNKTKIPILYRQGNPPSKNDFKRIIKQNPRNGYLQCLSNDQIKNIEILDKNKAFVTNNCVDTSFFKPQFLKRENFLLYLGRINYDKGTDIAIRISLDTGIPLKIAGPLQKEERFAQEFYNEKINPFLKDQIEYVGEVDDIQKRLLLSRAKALIVPNRWAEPFGIMNIEALSCGTPIIATNKGSLKEIILKNKTGFLCDNYDEMLEAISNINYLENDECRKDACKRFSVKKYIKETEAIYHKILS